MSRYYDEDDDYRRHRSSSRRGDHSRGRSPSPSRQEYYADSADISPPYMSTAQGRLAYDPQMPSFPPPPSASNPDFAHDTSLQVPSSHHHHRPRSQPPRLSSGRSEVSRRDSSRSPSPDRMRSGSRSPLGKAKHAVENTFSTSPSGIGVGMIGAIVGGLAAREASEAAARARDNRKGHGHGQGHHSSQDHQRTKLISTIIGAAVGGLGANAIEKHVENRRHDREQGRERDVESDRDYKSRELEYPNHSRDFSDRDRSRSRSRSSSAGRNRSRSDSNSRFERPQHGGTADAYYNTASRRDSDYR